MKRCFYFVGASYDGRVLKELRQKSLWLSKNFAFLSSRAAQNFGPFLVGLTLVPRIFCTKKCDDNFETSKVKFNLSFPMYVMAICVGWEGKKDRSVSAFSF